MALMPVTKQELIDAAMDAASLSDVVNGAADRPNPGYPAGTVTTRLGKVIKTVAFVIALIQVQEQQATAQAAAAAASAVQALQFKNESYAARLEAITAAASSNAAKESVAGLRDAINAAIADKPFAVAVGAGDATPDTIGVAKLAAIPANIRVIETRGYYTPGDGGGARYRRVAADPANAYMGFRSADRFMPDGSMDAGNGGWWVIVLQGGTVHSAQIGAIGDYANDANRGTDNFFRLKAAAEFREDPNKAIGPRIILGMGAFYSSQTLEFRATFTLESNSPRAQPAVYGFGRSWIITPTDITCVRILGNNQSGANGTNSINAPGSTGSRLKGIVFAQTTKGNDLTAHAIDIRAQVVIEDCTYTSIAGDGEHIEAFTNGGGRFGEANDCVLLNNFAHNVGGWGHWARGADVNALYCRGFQTQVCGLGGIYYRGYFLSKYVSPQLAGYGGGGVYHNGALWQLIAEGEGGITEPGTKPSTWYWRYPANAASAQFPQWQAGGNYPVQGPIYSTSDATFDTVYVEGEGAFGFSHAPRATIIGANYGWTDFSNVQGRAGYPFYRGQNGALNTPTTPVIGDAEFGGMFVPDPDHVDDNRFRRIIARYAWRGEDYRWKWRGDDMVRGLEQSGPAWSFTTNRSTRAFGGIAPVRNVETLHGFAICDETQPYDPANNERRLLLRINGPSPYGDHGLGTRVLNPNTTPGGIKEWVCVRAGATAAPGDQWGANFYPMGATVLADGRTWVLSLRGPNDNDSAYSQYKPIGASPFTDANGVVWIESLVRQLYQAEYLPAKGSAPAFNPAPVAAGAGVTLDVDVPGARPGAAVQVILSIDQGPLAVRGLVTGNDVIRVTYFNPTAAEYDMAAHDVTVVAQNS